jgi:hypothetical protein
MNISKLVDKLIKHKYFKIGIVLCVFLLIAYLTFNKNMLEGFEGDEEPECQQVLVDRGGQVYLYDRTTSLKRYGPDQNPIIFNSNDEYREWAMKNLGDCGILYPKLDRDLDENEIAFIRSSESEEGTTNNDVSSGEVEQVKAKIGLWVHDKCTNDDRKNIDAFLTDYIQRSMGNKYPDLVFGANIEDTKFNQQQIDDLNLVVDSLPSCVDLVSGAYRNNADTGSVLTADNTSTDAVLPSTTGGGTGIQGDSQGNNQDPKSKEQPPFFVYRDTQWYNDNNVQQPVEIDDKYDDVNGNYNVQFIPQPDEDKKCDKDKETKSEAEKREEEAKEFRNYENAGTRYHNKKTNFINNSVDDYNNRYRYTNADRAYVRCLNQFNEPTKCKQQSKKTKHDITSELYDQIKRHEEHPKDIFTDNSYTYISDSEWSLPQKRPPVCTSSKYNMENRNNSVAPLFTTGVYPSQLEYQGVGTIMPKFDYKEK